MIKVFFENDADLVKLYWDPIFKAVFTKSTPESRIALGDLLSSILDREVEVLAVVANEPPIENTRDKQIRYDVNCRFSTGEYANVEITVYPDNHEPKRLEYYGARLHASQPLKGKDISYRDIKETFQISIIVNNVLYPDNVMIHHFEYYDKVNGISLGGCSNIIVIELSKLGNVVSKSLDETTPIEDWAYFVLYCADKERRTRINQILERREGIAMAAQTLLTISQDEEERARLISEYKFIMDLQSKMVDARREGHAEGHTEGCDERNSYIVSKMLRDGVNIEIISKYTGLTLDEIVQIGIFQN